MMRAIVYIFIFTSVWAQTPNSPTPAPHVRKFVAPAYPWKARVAHMQGRTTSEIQIRADGTVESVKVTMSNPIFRDYVETALKQWEFEPTGKAFTQAVIVRFSLEAGCDNIRSLDASAYGETRVRASLPDLVEVGTCPEPITTTVN